MVLEDRDREVVLRALTDEIERGPHSAQAPKLMLSALERVCELEVKSLFRQISCGFLFTKRDGGEYFPMVFYSKKDRDEMFERAVRTKEIPCQEKELVPVCYIIKFELGENYDVLHERVRR